MAGWGRGPVKFALGTYLAGVVVLVAWPATAADFPQSATFHDPDSPRTVYATCVLQEPATLDCRFREVALVKNAAAEPLSGALSAIELFVARFEPAPAASCDRAARLADVLKQRRPADMADATYRAARAALDAMAPGRRADFAVRALATADYCLVPSRENLEALIAAAVAIDARTCYVRRDDIRVTLAWDAAAGQWLRSDGPRDECGFVDRDVLVPADALGRWTYRRVRAVTNPDVKAYIGTCAGFPQEDTRFDWRQPERFVDCDYVRF